MTTIDENLQVCSAGNLEIFHSVLSLFHVNLNVTCSLIILVHIQTDAKVKTDDVWD